MQPKLHVLICSTRPGRVGPAIARWFHDAAAAHGKFAVELIDLQDFALPVFDEPRHPRLQQYEHAHTRRWSSSVSEADAFVFVTPEYNYTLPPSLLNALNFLSHEWSYKPVGFVSYGGIGAGVRAVQGAKQVVTTLRMVPVLDAIPIPNVQGQLGADGVFGATDGQRQSVTPMLDDLHRLACALRPLRADSGGEAARERLLQLEQRRCAALMAKDLPCLAAIVAQDLVHVHANGEVEDYDAYMNFVRHKLEFLEVRRDDLQVAVHGTTALMSGPQTIIVRRPGEDGPGRRIDAFVMQHWALREVGWQQVGFQATATPKPAAASCG